METTINNKAINQSLTESEFKEIKQNVEGMFKMMEAIMQSWLNETFVDILWIGLNKDIWL